MPVCKQCNTEYPDYIDACPECSHNRKQKFACPTCQEEILFGERFCSECGSRLKYVTPTTCPDCDTAIKPDGKFCSGCGKIVPTDYEIMLDLDENAEPPVVPIITKKPDPSVTEVLESLHEEDMVKEEPVGETPKADESTLETNISEIQEQKEPVSLTEEIVAVDQKVVKPKSSRARWILIIIVLAIIVALVILWAKILPSAVGGKTPQTNSKPEATVSGDPVSVPPEPSVPDNGETSTTIDETSYTYSMEYAIVAQWDMVQAFDENGLARVMEGTLENPKVGVINREGNTIIPIEYDSIGDFHDHLTVVSFDGKFGYVDDNGTILVRPRFESATAFNEGMGVVSEKGKYGFINSQGEVKSFDYDYATPYENGFSAVKKDGKSFFIDASGNKASTDYEEAGQFSEGFAPVKIGGKWGFVDSTFTVTIEPQYDNVLSFQSGLSIATQGNKKFFIDGAGNQKSPKVDELWPLSDGMATVKDGGVFGYVDGTSTDYVIEPQYVDAYGYSDGLFPVSMNEGVWYYVNTNNELAFDKTFDHAYQFQEGVARVQEGVDYHLINTEGELAVPKTWENIGSCSQGMVPVQEYGKWGFVRLLPNN